MPGPVVARAEAVLALLEKQRASGGTVEELPLFAAAAPPAPVQPVAQITDAEERLIGALGEADPDTMSPREALEFLYRLKSM